MSEPKPHGLLFRQRLAEHAEVMSALEGLESTFETVAAAMTRAISAGRKICWMGNGGSAADAQHLAAELVGRFQRERAALPSIALTTDTSVLTAVGNDYGYDQIFARQLAALCQPGDVVVGLSTSGNSPNVLAAIELARDRNLLTVGFTGAKGGKLAESADHVFRVPSVKAARIQEAHIFLGHSLCEVVEDDVAR